MKFLNNLFKDKGDDAEAEQLSLEKLLFRSATEPAYRPEFYRRMLTDDLFILTAGNAIPDGRQTLEKETKISIVALEEGVIPVFTSAERIFDKGVITEQVQYIQIGGRDLLAMVKGAKLVLNPYSDYGKEFLPNEVEQMLDGSIFTASQQEITYQQNAQVLIGAPSKYPTEIVNSLSTLFAGKPRIAAAYVGWIHNPSTPIPPHYIFALKADGPHDQDLQNIIDEAGFTAKQHLAAEEFVDFFVVDNNGGISDYFLNSSEPFYTRS